MKTCKKCKVEKPVNINNFSKQKTCKDGFNTICRECKKTYYKERARKKHLQNSNLNKIQLKKSFKNDNPGVYGVFENGVCLYIGESKHIRQRINQHKTCINNPHYKGAKKHSFLYSGLRIHNNIIFGALEQTPNHRERESFYINKYQPLYNTNK